MPRELKIFFTALMFFTRIPVPKSTGYSAENLNASVRYFPLVGGIVGGMGAVVFLLFSFLLPPNLALLLSMGATIYLTGAFHEDGFADFCDGFGGGYTKEKILTIMKDSRIGTYGSVGLMLLLATKFGALHSFQMQQIPYVLVAAHVFNRFTPVVLMYASEYVREDKDAKAKPVGEQVSNFSLAVAAVFSVMVLAWFSIAEVVAILLISAVVFGLLYRYIRRKIGGYTGDVLGALQQLTEVGFYLALLSVQPVVNLLS